MAANQSHASVDGERRDAPKEGGEQVSDFELPGVDEDGIGTFSHRWYTDDARDQSTLENIHESSGRYDE